VRVSTEDQNLDRQIDALVNTGVDIRNISKGKDRYYLCYLKGYVWNACSNGTSLKEILFQKEERKG